MTVSPAKAVYAMLRTWRSAGIRHLELPDLGEHGPDGDPQETKSEKLAALTQKHAECRLCGLCQSRKVVVMGQGNPAARLMFVVSHLHGDEEALGHPLGGEAGELFDRMLEKMKLTRQDIYLSTVTKCATPGDREPEAGEMAACLPILHRQIDIIQPAAVCTMGSLASTQLLELELPIARLRGQRIAWRNTQVFPTFHPAYLVKKKAARQEVWNDMLAILSYLNTSNQENACHS